VKDNGKLLFIWGDEASKEFFLLEEEIK